MGFYYFRKSLITSKHGLAISVVEPTNADDVKYDDDEGKINLKLKPGIKTTLKLKISNNNAIETQAIDDEGQKLGLVIKSIEFLRYDSNILLTGKYTIYFYKVWGFYNIFLNVP